MRQSAYLRAIGEASELPDYIPTMKTYFKDASHSPRMAALQAIAKKARLDVDGLFNCELIKILQAISGEM